MVDEYAPAVVPPPDHFSHPAQISDRALRFFYHNRESRSIKLRARPAGGNLILHWTVPAFVEIGDGSGQTRSGAVKLLQIAENAVGV
jgi:hypothetical protein